MFEAIEKAGWNDLDEGSAAFEVPSLFEGKRGRIDVRVVCGTLICVIELKATDWDRILPHRVRATCLRHARQLWRYIEGEITAGGDVCAGIIYARSPSNPERTSLVEDLLAERFIQVVWRQEEG